MVVTPSDRAYPERLRHLNDPPAKLYLRGRIDLVNRVTLGVVGSRECTDYGRAVTRSLVSVVAGAGAVIVSGLARGIDAIAHEVALDHGSTTIAVLGCGIDVVYPRSNWRLYERIAEQGLLISEYEPGTPAFPYNFPHRNRIIAMLSRALLVIEATEKSGTRHTADVAGCYGEVMAVPGPIGSPTSVGTNQLLRDGAHVVLDADDVLRLLGLERPAPAEAPQPTVSPSALQVWKILNREPKHVDEVAMRLKLPASEVAFALLELELSGRVSQSGNGFYSRAAAMV